MKRLSGALMVLLLFPICAYAASAPAGFAPGVLWLSKTSASAGETITVFTVLYNSSPQAIEGDIDFDVDGDSIQTEHFKLSSGESKLFSADWSAQEGTHSFSAQLKHVAGISDGISITKSNTVTLSVAHAPPSLITTYVNGANIFIASSAPAVVRAAQYVASTTEGWRQAGAAWLSKALYTDQSPAPQGLAEGQILGTSSVRSAPAAQQSPLWTTLWRWVLTLLLYICNIWFLFYLVLAAVLYVLLRLAIALFRIRRPNG